MYGEQKSFDVDAEYFVSAINMTLDSRNHSLTNHAMKLIISVVEISDSATLALFNGQLQYGMVCQSGMLVKLYLSSGPVTSIDEWVYTEKTVLSIRISFS
jgi:hypothetical protein